MTFIKREYLLSPFEGNSFLLSSKYLFCGRTERERQTFHWASTPEAQSGSSLTGWAAGQNFKDSRTHDLSSHVFSRWHSEGTLIFLTILSFQLLKKRFVTGPASEEIDCPAPPHAAALDSWVLILVTADAALDQRPTEAKIATSSSTASEYQSLKKRLPGTNMRDTVP